MENEKFEYKSKKFIDELRRVNTIDKFEAGDKDLNAYFQAKKKRANKYGIDIKETYANAEIYEADSNRSKSFRDISYKITQETIRLRHDITIKKKNKKLYDHSSSDGWVTVDVVDLIDKNNLPKDDYSCPNCGNFASAQVLSTEGCPYCGTHFELPDLFPKISYYSYKERAVDLNKTSKDTTRLGLKVCVPIFILEVIISIIMFFEYDFQIAPMIGYWFIALFILFIIFAAVMGISYNVKATKDHFKHNLHAIKHNKISRVDDKSNENFENDMRTFSPNFNFQYFSSKVYNLLGTMIFAEKMTDVPSYKGPDFIGGFDSIVEYVPLGIKLHSFAAESQKFATIDLTVYADVYTYKNGKIAFKKEEFRLKVTKNLCFPIKFLFSARTYNCAGCSAPFDVTKTPTCPYCGRPHDVLDYDWYIDGPIQAQFMDMSFFKLHSQI